MQHQPPPIPSNVGLAALRTFFNIMDRWQLGSLEAQTLLGVPESTYYRWKKQPVEVDRDKLERLSYIFGIYKALHLIYSDEAVADGWLRRPTIQPLYLAGVHRWSVCWPAKSPTCSWCGSTSTLAGVSFDLPGYRGGMAQGIPDRQ